MGHGLSWYFSNNFYVNFLPKAGIDKDPYPD